MSDLSFWRERLTKSKELVVVIEDAITFLTVNPTQSYKLDTGQSEQEVTRTNLPGLNKMLESVLNRIATLEQRLNSKPTSHAPAW